MFLHISLIRAYVSLIPKGPSNYVSNRSFVDTDPIAIGFETELLLVVIIQVKMHRKISLIYIFD